jgi:anti-sigma regulatory factor (Ser/Thr protein kinase)
MTEGAGEVLAAGGLRSSRMVGDDLVMVLGDTLDAIEQGQARMAPYLEAIGLGPRATNRLEVVFEELIANVVRHGFDRAPDHGVALGHVILAAVGRRPGVVRLVVEDDGRPFDPFSVAEPPPFESLETAQIGGLGVAVVRRFAASTLYEAAPASELWRAYAGQGERPVNRVTVTLAAEA